VSPDVVVHFLGEAPRTDEPAVIKSRTVHDSTVEASVSQVAPRKASRAVLHRQPVLAALTTPIGHSDPFKKDNFKDAVLRLIPYVTVRNVKPC
jgi:hypothetical protein